MNTQNGKEREGAKLVYQVPRWNSQFHTTRRINPLCIINHISAPVDKCRWRRRRRLPVLFCSALYSTLFCDVNRIGFGNDSIGSFELGETDSCATLLDVEYFKWIHGELEGTKHWWTAVLDSVHWKHTGTVRLSRGVRACTCPAAASCDGGGAQWGQLGPFGNGRHCGRLFASPSLPAANHLNCLAAAAAVICASMAEDVWFSLFFTLLLSTVCVCSPL